METAVTLSVDGAMDVLEWKQTGGPEVVLPGAGELSFHHTPPFVHDTITLEATAKKAGCPDSTVSIALTPIATDTKRVYVAPPPLGDDSHDGSKESPLASIRHAIDVAAGGAIYVAEGVYSSDMTIVASNDVHMFGGYVPGAIWHRDHSTHVSAIHRDHAFTSAVAEDVLAFDCSTFDCTVGGFELAVNNVGGGTGKGTGLVVKLGAGNASIYENYIKGALLPLTDGHASIAIGDTTDFGAGGAGDVNIFSNRIEPGAGVGSIGVFLWLKATPLSKWIIANNYVLQNGGLEDTVSFLLNDAASLIGNTALVNDKAAAAYVISSNVYGNLFRAASGSVASGMGCQAGAEMIAYNSIFGFATNVDASCVNVTNLLTVDPLVDIDGHLAAGSPAIDFAPANNPAIDLLPPWDIDGQLRVKGNGLDLGCDEVK